MRSFRLRLALASAALSAGVLLAFGSASWWLVRNARLNQLESEMKTLAAREVGQLARSGVALVVDEARMAASLGLRNGSDLAVLAQTDQALRYQSPHWPPALQEQLQSRLLGVHAPTPGEVSPGWSWSAFAQAPPGNPGVGPGSRRGPGNGPPEHPGQRRRPTPPADRTPPDTDSGPAPVPERVQQAPASTVIVPPVGLPAVRSEGSRSVDSVATVPPVPEALEPPSLVSMPDVAQSTTAPAQSVKAPDEPPPAPVLHGWALRVAGQDWRVVAATLPQHRLILAVPVQALDADMRSIRNGFLWALPLTLALVGAVSWWLAGRALRPLQTLTQAVRRVTAEGLDRRLDARHEDHEFVELIEVFNRMLARLERSFGQANRFTADAAHELKTPLAIIQGQLERAMQQAQELPAVQASLSSTLDEVRRLSAISRKLLLLAQADAGRLRVAAERLNMSVLLAELLEDARMLAPELHVDSSIQPELWVEVDPVLIGQVLHNLISNAIKYNLPGGWLRVQTARWGLRLEVVVSNASSGIAPQDRNRLFERFFRADPAHARQVEGVGLGLSVSREIARAHGGDLIYKGEVSDRGVAFALLLPLA